MIDSQRLSSMLFTVISIIFSVVPALVYPSDSTPLPCALTDEQGETLQQVAAQFDATCMYTLNIAIGLGGVNS